MNSTTVLIIHFFVALLDVSIIFSLFDLTTLHYTTLRYVSIAQPEKTVAPHSCGMAHHRFTVAPL
jgi:hypothetical protein